MNARISFLLCTVAALMTAAALTGCDEVTGPGIPGTCSLDFESRFDSNFGDERIDSLLEATARFNVAATGLDADVNAACNAISADLGGASGEADTETACDNASMAIQGVLDANAMATLVVEATPAVCTVSATAVADCAARCDADFDVTATPIECTGGMLSGGCSGMCSGSCTVDGSVACTGSCSGSCSGSCDLTVEGTCTGTCNGQCEGTCSAMGGDGNCAGDCDGTCRGECMGTIEGSCSGECDGMCSGSCRADVTATCEGQCTGSCDVEFTEPRCEGGDVNVMANAECSASCEAEASVDVVCTDPEVVIYFMGSATVAGDLNALGATLQANLPVLLSAIEKGGIMASAAAELASTAGDAVDAAQAAGLEQGLCMLQAATVITSAVTNVQVSVQVSVEVNATASGGI